MKTNKSLKLLSEIRANSREIRRVRAIIKKAIKNNQDPVEWEFDLQFLLHVRTQNIIKYIKSLRVKSVPVQLLKSLLI